MPTTTRNYWPLGIVTAFALFVVGMASVVVIASTHRDHLVNDNYYEQELQFQTRIDGLARAQSAGATIRYDAVGGRIEVHLPVAPAPQTISGKLVLHRADDPKADCEFPFASKPAGLQIFDVSKCAIGPWLVSAAWTDAGKDFFLEQKIVIGKK